MKKHWQTLEETQKWLEIDPMYKNVFQVQEQLNKEREMINFKAQPADIIYKEPFIPKKSTKALTGTWAANTTSDTCLEIFSKCSVVYLPLRGKFSGILLFSLLEYV